MGYILVGIPANITSTLTVPGVDELRGHEIRGSEFNSRGDDLNIVIQSGSYNPGTNTYTIILTTYGEQFYEEVMVGDVIKLQSHNSTPNLSSYSLEVTSKQTVGIEKSITLALPTGVSVVTNGGNTGYIQIENIFIVARGIVGVI
jgi:hypothetical protein